jgi:crotonobetainyl-CoA:carnitine CoA-transferase CaiB-like acyl-CoA transferase
VEHAILGTIQVVGQAVHLTRTPQRMRSAAPDKGEHTDSILAELGYDSQAIPGLRERRII